MGIFACYANFATGTGNKEAPLQRFSRVSPAQSFQSEGTRTAIELMYGSASQDETYNQNSPLDSRLVGANHLATKFGTKFYGVMVANDMPLIFELRAFNYSETGSNTFNYGVSSPSSVQGTDGSNAVGAASPAVAQAELTGYTYKMSGTGLEPSLGYVLFDSISLGIGVETQSMDARTSAYTNQIYDRSHLSMGVSYFTDVLETGIGYRSGVKYISDYGLISIFDPPSFVFWARFSVVPDTTIGVSGRMLSNSAEDDGEKNGVSALLSVEHSVGDIFAEAQLVVSQAFHENNENMLGRNVGGYELGLAGNFSITDGFSFGGGIRYLRRSGAYSLGSASQQKTLLLLRGSFDL